MRGGLVRHDVDGQFPGPVAGQEFGEDFGGVAHVADGPAAALGLGCLDFGDRGVQVGFDLVQVALADPAAQPGLVDVHDQAGPVVQGHRERLGPAHAPHPPVSVSVPANGPRWNPPGRARWRAVSCLAALSLFPTAAKVS
ncbi:hypothetical protein AHiyo8_31110 [Arthrobacter sp. Hiyo8]|nr:hypothetical protein AHiyo8_31110 [Arthrobacter sp. Hiyo8]